MSDVYSGITSSNYNNTDKKHYRKAGSFISSCVVTLSYRDLTSPPNEVNVDILISKNGSSESWATIQVVDLSSTSTFGVSIPQTDGILGVRLSNIPGNNVLTMTISQGGFLPVNTWLSDPTTIRICVFDGGGMRGLYSMWGLYLMCSRYLQYAIPPNALNQFFDVMCGTSIGGLATIALCFGKDPLEIFNIIKDNGKHIFTMFDPDGYETGQATKLDQLNWIKGVYPLREISLYKNTVLQQVVDSIVNDPGTGQSRLMSDIQGSRVIIPTIQYSDSGAISDARYPKRGVARYLSNFPGEGLYSGWTAKDVAMATSAAQMYLPPWVASNGITCVDGGSVQNNMVCEAYTQGKRLKPYATRMCIASFGTGLEDMGVANPISDQMSPNLFLKKNLENSYPDIPNINAQILLDTINMSITLAQEANNRFLTNLASTSDMSIYKYRFNTDLDLTKPCQIDSTSDEAIAYFVRAAEETIERDQAEIEAFMDHLTLRN